MTSHTTGGFSTFHASTSTTPAPSVSLPLGNMFSTAYRSPSNPPVKVSQKQISAEIVAWKFVAFCRDHGEWLTNLRIQRLLYYAQAWHLALKGKPLFADEIAAWSVGPVVPSVYREYGRFGGRPIDFDPPRVATPSGVDQHVESVMEAYGSLSAFDLERLIKSESPWRDARGNLDMEQTEGPAIPHEAMERYYKASISGKK